MKTLTPDERAVQQALSLSRKRNAAYLASPSKGAAIAAVVAVSRARTLLAGLRR